MIDKREGTTKKPVKDETWFPGQAPLEAPKNEPGKGGKGK
ncbi:hypothetical protein PS691_05029 [Pseudomonas fluorescens]|uniref:Uncharacterized protein n=1 Tax=Pseudomonas fluorescens TaxID=294 RepID=A0A5E7F1H1_PSEFL|nr:hypothetical protein PS691_05029 [Pseudomonas fluorescens]